MLFPTVAFVLVAGVMAATLSSSRSPATKGVIIFLAVALFFGALVCHALAPGSPWAPFLACLLIFLAAFAWATKPEQDDEADLTVVSQCPFCGEAFTFHRDAEGKSRSCRACRNIFPTSADESLLMEYARNTRELMAAADGAVLKERPLQGTTAAKRRGRRATPSAGTRA